MQSIFLIIFLGRQTDSGLLLLLWPVNHNLTLSSCEKMFLAVIVQTQFLFVFIRIKSCGGHSLIKTQYYNGKGEFFNRQEAPSSRKEENQNQ